MNASTVGLDLLRRDLGTGDDRQRATRGSGRYRWDGWLYRRRTDEGPDPGHHDRSGQDGGGGRASPGRRRRRPSRTVRPELVDITRAVRIVPWT